MAASRVRVKGWKSDAQPLRFVHLVRLLTGMNVRSAKVLLDRLLSEDRVEFAVRNPSAATLAGREMLRAGLIREAEMLAEGEPPQSIAAPIPPPAFACPVCRQVLADRNECGKCSWLRFAGDRNRWGSAGPCPRCAFSYRYDGTRCSHCGLGAAEHPPISMQDSI
jgi:hypothetical protein